MEHGLTTRTRIAVAADAKEGRDEGKHVVAHGRRPSVPEALLAGGLDTPSSADAAWGTKAKSTKQIVAGANVSLVASLGGNGGCRAYDR